MKKKPRSASQIEYIAADLYQRLADWVQEDGHWDKPIVVEVLDFLCDPRDVSTPDDEANQ